VITYIQIIVYHTDKLEVPIVNLTSYDDTLVNEESPNQLVMTYDDERCDSHDCFILER
jgi:hypothetical protein